MASTITLNRRRRKAKRKRDALLSDDASFSPGMQHCRDERPFLEKNKRYKRYTLTK